MLKTKRLEMIQDYINERGTVSLDDLVNQFGVSKNTIRRDVQDLIDGGDFKKVYGGVAVDKPNSTIPYGDRKIRNYEVKKQIGQAAANFVEDGDIIFIDSGTTTVEMVEFIKDKELTIITNNIDFVIKALPYENLNVFSTGGMVERKTNSFTSADNDEMITSYNITKAFLASTGISIKNGVTNSLPLESGLKRSVVERSAENFLLVDHSKFNKAALTTYCDIKQIDYIVTNEIPNEYINYSNKNKIKVVVTEK
ncbi:DeoR/GlpR family DNA-binding transcription regulator [Aquibacillus sediminis]|uniref:DeoR/GlpR family DNA-binding transcription regulator n=1 Tax=Aquibacillus sediminis TaxID=2574734 RepID=UPI001108F72C|nr:DeoR/GlpR family DNA-binding transcription regulator [Aquibacillus sediminis]